MKIKPTYFQSLIASWVPLAPWQCRLVDYVGTYECLTVQRVGAARKLISQSGLIVQELLEKYVQSIREAKRLFLSEQTERIVESFLKDYDKQKQKSNQNIF